MRGCTYSTYFKRGTVRAALHGKALTLPTGTARRPTSSLFLPALPTRAERDDRAAKQGLSQGPASTYALLIWTYPPQYFKPGEINLCQLVGASQISRLG